MQENQLQLGVKLQHCDRIPCELKGKHGLLLPFGHQGASYRFTSVFAALRRVRRDAAAGETVEAHATPVTCGIPLHRTFFKRRQHTLSLRRLTAITVRVALVSNQASGRGPRVPVHHGSSTGAVGYRKAKFSPVTSPA